MQVVTVTVNCKHSDVDFGVVVASAVGCLLVVFLFVLHKHLCSHYKDQSKTFPQGP